MRKSISIAVVLGMLSLVTAFTNVSAAEPTYELKATSIKEVLAENMGKRVTVRLQTGENLEGIVSKVGDSLVHLSKITTRDFYDAVVRIDTISAVVFRVRGN
jgi:small nuclear ribonucleoprotein (snRNP)-like protein